MSREDDAPSGPYWREELPPHLKESTFFAATPTRAEGQAFFDAWFAKAYPTGKIVVQHADREGARLEDQAATLNEAARAWGEEFVKSLSPSERVASAAPARYGKRRVKRGEFHVRKPEYIEPRHSPFLDCTNFGERAVSLGYSANYGATIRAEIVLLHLLRGEIPPWAGVLDARAKNALPEDGQILAAFYPGLNEAHEALLVEAESRQITRTPLSPLRSKKARLLGETFSALSDAKLAANHLALRTFFKGLQRVVEMCRAEVLAP